MPGQWLVISTRQGLSVFAAGVGELLHDSSSSSSSLSSSAQSDWSALSCIALAAAEPPTFRANAPPPLFPFLCSPPSGAGRELQMCASYTILCTEGPSQRYEDLSSVLPTGRIVGDALSRSIKPATSKFNYTQPQRN